jgi:hypothetical protein
MSGAQIMSPPRGMPGVSQADALLGRGVTPEFAKRAADKVAEINNAWDRIKRARKL